MNWDQNVGGMKDAVEIVVVMGIVVAIILPQMTMFKSNNKFVKKSWVGPLTRLFLAKVNEEETVCEIDPDCGSEGGCKGECWDLTPSCDNDNPE